MEGRQTFALIPAGGRSRRMGRPKLTLPLGGSTVLERVVAAVRAGGVDRVLVVAGPEQPDLVDLARAAGADVCRLPEATADMRATVEYGLRWIEERFPPGPDDAWLLVPGDHPTLEADAVRRLLAESAQPGEDSVWVPTFEGRRGHPVLIRWRHVAGIRAFAAGQGINAYLRRHPAETVEVPVASAAVLDDLDRPEDYERLRERFG